MNCSSKRYETEDDVMPTLNRIILIIIIMGMTIENITNQKREVKKKHVNYNLFEESKEPGHTMWPADDDYYYLARPRIGIKKTSLHIVLS